MAPRALAYLTYSEVSKQKCTIDDFRTELRKFARESCLRACSTLNSLLESWKRSFDEGLHTKLVRDAFAQPLADQLITLQRPIFHRQQILFVAKEAARFCGEAGRDTKLPYWGGLGIVLLMANDILGTQEQPYKSEEERLLGWIVRLLPSIEGSHFHQFQTKVLRSYLMLTRFVEPLRAKTPFFDIGEIFERSMGMPLMTYCTLVFAVMSRFGDLDLEKLKTTPELFSVDESWFRSTRVPPEVVKTFLSDVSGSAEEFAARFSSSNPGISDFTVFKDKPFLRDGGRLFPIDFSFIAEKFESGPFWKVNDYLQKSDREQFHAFWGRVFEGYMNWLLAKTAISNANIFFPSPEYQRRNGEQICDGIILSKDAVILIEYKGSTFSALAKYASERDFLGAEIESKLVGTEKRPKGVRQLLNAVTSLFRRDNPERIRNVDLTGRHKVIPLIVTRDDIGSSWGTNAYLEFRFRTLMGRERKRLTHIVTPLFCMAAEDMEKISNRLSDMALADMIEERYRADPKLMATFFTIDYPILRNWPKRMPDVQMLASEGLKDTMMEILGLPPKLP